MAKQISIREKQKQANLKYYQETGSVKDKSKAKRTGEVRPGVTTKRTIDYGGRDTLSTQRYGAVWGPGGGYKVPVGGGAYGGETVYGGSAGAPRSASDLFNIQDQRKANLKTIATQKPPAKLEAPADPYPAWQPSAGQDITTGDDIGGGGAPSLIAKAGEVDIGVSDVGGGYGDVGRQPVDFSDIVGEFKTAMAEANRANEARYSQGLGIWDQIATQYAPGGGFGAGALAQLDRAKTRDVASAQQQMMSSGLWGTTVAAGLGKKWEEEVGAPSRLQISDIQSTRYGEALAGKAGFVERRTDAGPDLGQFSNLLTQASSGPTAGAGAGYGSPVGRTGGSGGGAMAPGSPGMGKRKLSSEQLRIGQTGYTPSKADRKRYG